MLDFFTKQGIFNPRLREGGDNVTVTKFVKASVFNPRLREGGDGMSESSVKNKHSFQSTPPRRRRLNMFYPVGSVYVFNPRLREGGDKSKYEDEFTAKFSIHASAKEATATYCNTPAIMCISSLNNFFVHHF